MIKCPTGKTQVRLSHWCATEEARGLGTRANQITPSRHSSQSNHSAGYNLTSTWRSPGCPRVYRVQVLGFRGLGFRV
jgi:hypothetical protein